MSATARAWLVASAAGVVLVGAAAGDASPRFRDTKRWVVHHVVTDAGRGRTEATIVGSDRVRPVAGRIRVLAPRGRVRIVVDPVCIYGNRWAPGGITHEELESHGRPIVRTLSRGVVPRPRSRTTEPTYCRWTVTVSGAGGAIWLELLVLS